MREEVDLVTAPIAPQPGGNGSLEFWRERAVELEDDRVKGIWHEIRSLKDTVRSLERKFNMAIGALGVLVVVMDFIAPLVIEAVQAAQR